MAGETAAPSSTTTPPGLAPASAPPVLRRIGVPQVREALRKGFEDFRKAPIYGLFFGAAYVIGGYVLWAIAHRVDNAGLLVPLAFVFPLLGPFAAIGLYEVSRRLETGAPLDWGPILRAPIAKSDGQIPFMGVIVLFLALVWIVVSRIAFALFMGDNAITNIFSSLEALASVNGVLAVLAVTAVGFAVAALVFSISVIGMPLLLDRDIDVVTAIITSLQAVAENLRPMAVWAGIVVALLVVGMLPAFIGLVVVLPVLGHATWHLYRAVVAPAEAA